MIMEKFDKEAIHHLKNIIDLVNKYPNNIDLGDKVRQYINNLGKNE